MNTLEHVELVSRLNQKLYDRMGETEHSFIYSTNGYVDAIRFDDLEIWNSENDNREYLNDTNQRESLDTFIPAEFDRIVAELYLCSKALDHKFTDKEDEEL